MRLALCVAVVLGSGCAGVRATPGAAVVNAASLQETPGVTVRPPTSKTPLAVERVACPLTAKTKSAPSCFKPLDVSAPGLIRAWKSTCRFATLAQFVGVKPALSVLINVIEGNVGFSIPFLFEGDGSTHVVPDALGDAVWSNGELVGVGADGKHRGFWKGGTCEVPPEGHFGAPAPLTDGRFVALWSKDDRSVEVVERATDGTWSSWGPSLQVQSERLVARQGRVALIFDSTTSSPQRDFGTEHPDLGRTRVLGRMREQPKYTEYIPWHGWFPLAPAAGATFSNAIAVSDGSLGGEPVMFVPRGDGSVRLPLPELAFDAKQPEACRAPEQRQPVSGPWASASATGGVAWGPGVLLARLESRGQCTARLVDAPPRNCPPGAPCAPPEGPRPVVERTETSVSLVLINVGGKSGRLMELKLPPRAEDDGGRFARLAVATTDTEVLVSAEGFFFVFDRAELERRAR
ncbi:MAG: hypothetical protein U0228_11250 [Myxococcaceae bacterium]